MISKEVSKQILTVGENYRVPRGGISSVINTYSKHFTPFKFVPTYNPLRGKIFNIFYFGFGILGLLKKLLFDKHIQIVHIHGCHDGSFYRKLIVFIISRFLFEKKIIYHSHGSDFHLFYENSNPLIKKIIQFFISNIDVLVCLSGQWKQFFLTNFQLRKCIILENIIERPHELKNKAVQEPVVLLFLGEIGDRKGIFDLLEVLKNNKEFFYKKLRLIIGGNGDVKRMVQFIQDFHLEEIVQFEGWVSGEKKHQLLMISDIFILPSYNEGLPISILEAMSYQKAIMSTDVGGISEVVHHKVNGYLLKPGNRKQLLEYLVSVVNNPSTLSKMGQQSLAIISPYYSDAVIPKLEKLYHQVLIN